MLGAAPDAWETVYTLVDGTLPLGELRKAGQPDVTYLQGEIDVIHAGAVELRLETKAPLTFWIDEEQFDRTGTIRAELTPGRHRVTVRIAAAGDRALRVEVHKPAGSRAQLEVVHAD